MSGVRRRAASRVGAVVLVPVAASVTQVVATVVTTRFNWWLFGVLVVLSAAPVLDRALESRRPDGNGGDPAPGRSGRRTVAGLPPPVGTRVFTGRDEDLRRLVDHHVAEGNTGPLILAVTGLGGTGKTELAVCAARQLTDRYPDGLFWLELRTYAAAESRMRPAQALRLLLNALGVSPDPQVTGVPALSRAWRSVTEGRRVLLVLDDVDDAQQVRPLLPTARTCAVLVTSRHALTGLDPDTVVALDVFSREEACALAQRILERTGHPDPTAADAIAESYRLPLTVRRVADLKAANPGVRLSDLLAHGDQGAAEATASPSLSLRSLPADARRVLLRTAHYPGSLISPEIAAVMVDQTLSAAQALLADLYRQGLLLPDRRAGYRMHDLVRAAARSAAMVRDSGREWAACDERLFRYAHAAASQATRALYCAENVAMPTSDDVRNLPVRPPSFASDIEALAWLDEQHSDLLAIARRCVAQRSPRAWRLIYQLEYYQRIRGFYDEITDLHGQALRLSEERGDQLGQAGMHQNLGLVCMRTGDYPGARSRFRRALELYTATGSPTGQAEIHHELHHIDCWLGDLASARAHAEAEFRFAQAGGTTVDLAAAHVDLGAVDRLEGRHDSARHHLTMSLGLYGQTGQPRGIATAHRHLGLLATDRGDHQEAHTHFDQAMTRYTELGDVLNQAETHIGLAVLQRRVGDLGAAHHHASTALDLSVSVSHWRGQAEAHDELATLARCHGQHETLTHHNRQASEIYGRLGIPSSSA
ncbi:tetratricopeptide repeat protein [Streptomyces puniciscabiei]|uniref:tetratricopeptide repeat protein n=1 Tax=Streptomyces puniciscabiei TaxID=164348 RepID=UPI0037B2D49E